jgi:hypothetical protein
VGSIALPKRFAERAEAELKQDLAKDLEDELPEK